MQSCALLADIGHDRLGCVRGGRRAVVGNEVQQGSVGFVADRAHKGSAAGRRGAHERLVAERKKVLNGPAAACDDDDLDVLASV